MFPDSPFCWTVNVKQKETEHSFFLSSEELRKGASQFKHNAASVKRKMWWQNFKVCHFCIDCFTLWWTCCTSSSFVFNLKASLLLGVKSQESWAEWFKFISNIAYWKSCPKCFVSLPHYIEKVITHGHFECSKVGSSINFQSQYPWRQSLSFSGSDSSSTWQGEDKRVKPKLGRGVGAIFQERWLIKGWLLFKEI